MMEITKITIVVLFINICLFINYCKSEQCDLKGSSQMENIQKERLNKLIGKKYKTSDAEFSYYFAVCDVPDQVANKSLRTGIYQDNGKENGRFALGRLTDVDLEGGQQWIRLTYKDGDKYANSCNKTARKAVVFILCAYDKEDTFSIIEENNKREDDCGYLFQLETSAICPERKDPSTTIATTAKIDSKKSSQPSGLGIFGIVMICVFSLFAVYFIVGFTYMRFIRQARGWQQMPNFRFWNKFGNMQADMCDYVCRCGGGDNDLRAQPYESLTGQMSDDENMLNV